MLDLSPSIPLIFIVTMKHVFAKSQMLKNNSLRLAAAAHPAFHSEPCAMGGNFEDIPGSVLWEFWVQDPPDRTRSLGWISNLQPRGVWSFAQTWRLIGGGGSGRVRVVWRSRSSCWPGAGKRHGSLGRNNVLIKKESCWPQGPERRQVVKKSWLWGQCAQTTFACCRAGTRPAGTSPRRCSAVTQVVPQRWFPSTQWVCSGGGSQAWASLPGSHAWACWGPETPPSRAQQRGRAF
uniref:Uncharacterized protein n=1 Tax=Pipistrellus kuhlii TaxID=59472 RepID=A0A7J7TAH8_PIPKU|nr:hypothetical protein mPipKuh1_009677 [Pipistrellus kuhlii]